MTLLAARAVVGTVVALMVMASCLYVSTRDCERYRLSREGDGALYMTCVKR